MTPHAPPTLAIIGAGNMAEAIVRGLLAAKIIAAGDVVAADPSETRRAVFESIGVRAVASAADAVRGAKTILLSVKPQSANDVLISIGEAIDDGALFVSIMAGKTSSSIEAALSVSKNARVVRVMPNTPMLVGEGAAGIASGRRATADDLAFVRRMFECGGKVIEIDEQYIDAVTALSGSGPAYFFLLVEQMIAAGVKMGLSPADAKLLAIQTAVGSAKMLATSSDSPEELRKKVTSPKGTTDAAITTMQSRGMDTIIGDAILAAEARGKELGAAK